MNHLHHSRPGNRVTEAVAADEVILEISKELWAATSFEDLLKAFRSLLKKTFDIEYFNTFKVQDRGNKLSLNKYGVGLDERHELKAFEREFMEQLGTSLVSLSSLTDFCGGVSRLVCRGQRIQMAIIGVHNKTSYLCVWNEVQADAEPLLEMFVHLVQNEARWYRKLDSTQALLYLDELTGLFNYRYLDIALESEIRRASRYQQNFSLLFIDLDNFKAVNDRYGHLAGSSVLKQVGGVLREELREVDTIIRYGGDEYVVILLGATTTTGVLVAERIRKRIAQTLFQVEDSQAKLTSSIGVASYPEHGRDKDALLRMADETMYRSKRGGKNRVMIVGGNEGPFTGVSDTVVVSSS